jgi:hypothetical protein
VTSYLASTGVPWREVAPGEWGFSTEAGGWPLHVGIALRDGLLRVQAEVAGPGALDPHALLHRNRRRPLVRFTETGAGAVWVQADLPLVAVDEAELDRTLGLLVEAAQEARAAARPGSGGGSERPSTPTTP